MYTFSEKKKCFKTFERYWGKAIFTVEFLNLALKYAATRIFQAISQKSQISDLKDMHVFRMPVYKNTAGGLILK